MSDQTIGLLMALGMVAFLAGFIFYHEWSWDKAMKDFEKKSLDNLKKRYPDYFENKLEDDVEYFRRRPISKL